MTHARFTGLLSRKKAVRYLIYLLLVCVFAVFVFKLNQVEKTELVVRTGQTFEKGKVTEILQDNLDSNGTRVGEQKVRVKMLTGVRKGEELDVTSSSGYLFGAACTVGMKVIVMQSVAGETTIASVYSQDREWVIYIFALLYLLALCIIGGKQGIKGCLGLIFTFFCVIFVYLPLVYLGYSPFWSAVFICFLTTLVTMYLIGGPTKKTCAATLGTLAGVVLAGISAWCFSKASGISGYNVSDIETLMTLWNTNRIQVGGLLFSGLLISCLGAVMDVAMSISSAIDEIYKQNSSLTRKELFKAGMRVGRDMMGTDSNTLILAFAGSSVSTLLLDYAYDLPYQQIINSNNIGIAIMQGLAGSFGIVLSVPLTVLICTILFHRKETAVKL
ncbi:YibE/F family protein [Blautia sp. MSK17_66]|uniref:YibE/F family protein n=1 Tax=Blautia TaxID=572511 RepID=UPI00156F93A2|nr:MULTISPECIES: YibE/F family protein [Blautia]MCB5550291.1 YibE/F family protein [Blautia sp. MSK17_66]NSK02549.1 YibE/F family protein [Blautia obeum]